MNKNDTIIVTGANGLAGSAIVNHLRNEMFTCVIPITRNEVDLTDHKATHDYFERICGGPSHVVHTAATVYGLGGNMANQAKSILDNTLINTAVIDAAYRSGCKKITVMGTNAAYPWPTLLPFHEELIYNGRPDKGEFGYGHAKRHMLAMLEAYHQSYGLEYCYIVSGNLYGPRDKFNSETGHVLPSLIAKFARALDTGGIVEVWGDGSATRDFLYSADLARIVLMLMSEEIKSGPINIGNGASHSIREVVQLLCSVTGLPADRVRWDGSKPNGRKECHADLTKLHGLGFTPDFCLAEGVHRTWKWFRNSTEVLVEA